MPPSSSLAGWLTRLVGVVQVDEGQSVQFPVLAADDLFRRRTDVQWQGEALLRPDMPQEEVERAGAHQEAQVKGASGAQGLHLEPRCVAWSSKYHTLTA